MQLVQRLREQDPAVTPALDWLDRRLARESTTADELVHVEHQEQIANHATVRNVITSMRLLSQADWADFFESVSLVHDGAVRRARAWRRWTFRRATGTAMPSRSSRGGAGMTSSRWPGGPSAWRPHAASAHAEPRHGDPGYYLIAKGRAALERDLELPGSRPAVASPRVGAGGGAPVSRRDRAGDPRDRVGPRRPDAVRGSLRAGS